MKFVRPILPHLIFLLIIWLVPLVIYLKTLSPSILYIDAGTMLAASYTLGIPNPPGFPLYMLVGYAFTHLPFGTVLFRLQLLSILSALGTLTMVYFLVQGSESVIGIDSRVRGNDKKVQNNKLTTLTLFARNNIGSKLAGLVAALALAFSYEFWSQTINSESYIFTNFLMVILLGLLLIGMDSRVPGSGSYNLLGRLLRRFAPRNDIGSRALLGAFLLGIFSGSNPTITQVVPALILGTFFYWKEIGIKRILAMVAIVIVTGFAVYSYLPIRAMHYPFVNWGNPQTVPLFIDHLHGAGLNINDPRTNSVNGFTGSPQVFGQSVGRYVYLAFVQFTPILLPLILWGMVTTFKQNRKKFFLLMTVPVTNLIYGGLYLSGNQESWFIGSYVVFAIFLGLGLGDLLGRLSSVILEGAKRPIGSKEVDSISHSVASRMTKSQKSKIKNQKSRSKVKSKKSSIFYHPSLIWFAYGLALLLPLIPLIWWAPKLDRSNNYFSTDYMNNLYHNLPKKTVLIGSGDFFNSMSLYQHEVIKDRQDVFPVVANMWYILPWYRDNLRHQNPEIMPKELETMIKKDRLEEYREVMNWYIEYLMNKGYAVYVTPMVFQESVLAGTDAGKFVPNKEKLKAVPMGLAYRMLTANDLLQPSEDNFKYQFNGDIPTKKQPFYLERNYNGAYNQLLGDYAASFLAMVDYFNNNQQPQKAKEYLEKAYLIDPNSPQVLNSLAIVAIQEKNYPQAIDYFKKAITLDPKNPSLKINLGSVMLESGDLMNAQQIFQSILSSDADPDSKQAAQTGLSRITSSQLYQSTTDWKQYEDKVNHFQFRYPSDWTAKSSFGVITVSSPDQTFEVQMELGSTNKLKFDGQKQQSGAAQIPGYDAKTTFWSSGYLEFTLTQDKKTIHIKVGPQSSPFMKNFDQILSSMQFTN